MKGAKNMNVSYKIISDVLLLTPELDVLDTNNADAFRASSIGIINEINISNVVLDLKNLTFIDSLGIGRLISLLRNLKTRNGDLRVSSLSNTIKAIFELVRLNKIIDIFDEPEEAVRSF